MSENDTLPTRSPKFIISAILLFFAFLDIIVVIAWANAPGLLKGSIIIAIPTAIVTLYITFSIAMKVGDAGLSFEEKNKITVSRLMNTWFGTIVISILVAILFGTAYYVMKNYRIAASLIGAFGMFIFIPGLRYKGTSNVAKRIVLFLISAFGAVIISELLPSIIG